MATWVQNEKLYDKIPFLGEKLDCKQVRFNFDSHVMLPHGLEVIADAYRHLDATPGLKLLVVGHTDTMGSRTYNETLSAARAHNVASLMKGGMAPFMFSGSDPERADADTQDYIARYPTRQMCPVRTVKDDVRDPTLVQILRWISAQFGDIAPWAFPDFKSGPVNWGGPVGQKALGSLLAGAVKLGGTSTTLQPRPTYAVDKSTFMAIEYFYRARLAEMLGLGRSLSALAAPMSKVSWAIEEQPSLGCGENHPKVKPNQDNFKCYDNRRVEVLFFPAEKAPTPVDLTPKSLGNDKKAYPLYDVTRFKFVPLDCPPAEFGGFEIPEGKHVFLIDVSTSMASGGSNYRINRAKVELTRALFGMAEQTAEGDVSHEFAVLAYSAKHAATEHALEVPATVQYWKSGSMRPASWLNQESAEEWVTDLVPAGATCTYKGMEAALGVTSATHLYLLSDGHPTVDEREARSTETAAMQAAIKALVDRKQALRSADDKLTIATFGFDAPGTSLGQFLQSLATAGGGYHRL